jgi:hypothetical protein
MPEWHFHYAQRATVPLQWELVLHFLFSDYSLISNVMEIRIVSEKHHLVQRVEELREK